MIAARSIAAVRAAVTRRALPAAAVVAMLAVACDRDGARTGTASGDGATPPAAAAEPLDYTPPPDSLVSDDALGASIRRGRALFVRTTDSLPAYAPGNIQCASCHLDAGRRPDAAPVVGVMARYPKYLDRSGAVVTIHDRVNFCFTRSLAGT